MEQYIGTILYGVCGEISPGISLKNPTVPNKSRNAWRQLLDEFIEKFLEEFLQDSLQININQYMIKHY